MFVVVGWFRLQYCSLATQWLHSLQIRRNGEYDLWGFYGFLYTSIKYLHLTPHCFSVIRPPLEQTRRTSTEEEKCPPGGVSGGL